MDTLNSNIFGIYYIFNWLLIPSETQNLLPDNRHSPCPTLHIRRVQAEGWPVNRCLGQAEGNAPNRGLHWNCTGPEPPRGSSRECTFTENKASALYKHKYPTVSLHHKLQQRSPINLLNSTSNEWCLFCGVQHNRIWTLRQRRAQISHRLWIESICVPPPWSNAVVKLVERCQKNSQQQTQSGGNAGR